MVSCGCLPNARARERAVPISELVFGTLTRNRSSLEPSLGSAAIAGTPRIENGGPFAVDFANGRRDGITLSSGMRPKIFGVQFADGRRDCRPAWCATTFSGPALVLSRACTYGTRSTIQGGRQSRQIQEKAQDYSGFESKSQ